MKGIKQTGMVACIGLSLFLGSPAFPDDVDSSGNNTTPLAAGKWKGFYKPVRSDRNDATYIVEYDDSGSLRIEMKLDLEPRDKFVFTLSEIKLDEETLAFTFGEEEYLRDCTLYRKTNGGLEGDCFYRSDEERTVRATIEMRPPPEDADTSQADTGLPIE